MQNNKKKIDAELKAVCRLRAWRRTRMILIFVLAPLYYFFHETAVYLLAALVVFPAALDYAIRTARPEQDREYIAHALLPETMRENHFVFTRYRAERISFTAGLLLLAFWQWVQPRISWHGLPVWRIPGLLLISWFIAGQILTFYHYYRLRSDFLHVRIR